MSVSRRSSAGWKTLNHCSKICGDATSVLVCRVRRTDCGCFCHIAKLCTLNASSSCFTTKVISNWSPRTCGVMIICVTPRELRVARNSACRRAKGKG